MTDAALVQLTLPLSGVPDPDFASFYPKGNEQLLYRLQRLADGDERGLFYLWGSGSAGKSHLLQALCLQAQQQGIACLYLAGRELLRLQADVLAEMQDWDLLCIDDVDRLLGTASWEEALFHLYNRQRDAGASLVVTASLPPRQLPPLLADLQSRFTAMELYQVHSLTDDDKCQVLCQAAHQRGFALNDEVAAFILQRSSRDMLSLQQVLQRLDQQSLSQQRLITLPFVKQVMGW